MKYIIGNWKMNPKKKEDAKALMLEIKKVAKEAVKQGIQPVVCPPSIFIQALISKSDKNLQFGAQNTSINNDGMETGEVSSAQYDTLGVKYIILGHSECRSRGEISEIVAIKVLNAVKTGLTVVLCIGEKTRDSGGRYFSDVAVQLRASLLNFPENKISKLIIAYEPVWAIGENSTHSASPRDFEEMAMLIRRTLAEQFNKDKAFSVPLLYGGSVNKKNAKSYIDVGADGLLVGRASLKAKEFISIVKSAIVKKI